MLSKDAIEARNLADEIKKMEKMRDEWSNTESDFSNIDDDSLDELERYSEMRQKRARDILDGKYPNEEISRTKSKKLKNKSSLSISSIRTSPINFKKSLHKRFLEESKMQV